MSRICDELHKSIPLLTKYEYTNILGIRAKQINEGCNQNEVVLSVKKSKNIGFFERFFNYFS